MAAGSEWIDSYPSDKRLVRARLGLGLTIAVLVFGAGVAAGGAMSRSPRGGAAAQMHVSTRPGAGPTDVLNAVPVGYSRTADGAAAAAENFLTAGSGTLVADKAKYLAAMSAMAAPEWKPRAIETGRNAVTFFRDRYGTKGTLLTAPLAVDVVGLEHETARVKIWSVSVANGAKHPDGEQVWGVTTFDLRWVRGDWRVAGAKTQSSPAAVLLEGQRLGPVESLVETFGPGSAGPQNRRPND